MKKLLPCIFLLISFNLNAQNPQWINYSTDFLISDIEFEGNYVWVATFGGLVRFDRITNTKVVYNGANSGISVNYINDILIDKVGNKWITSNYGVVIKFDNLNWTNYSILPNGDSFFFPRRMRCDVYNNVYLLSATQQNYAPRIFKFDGNNFIDIASPTTNIIDFDIDGLGHLWIADQDSGVWTYNGISWTNFSSFPSGKTASITVDTLNNVWINRNNYSTNSGAIWKYDGVSWNLIAPIGYHDSKYTHLDPDNNVWIYGYDINGFLKCSGNIVQNITATSQNLPMGIYSYPSAFAIDSVGDWWMGLFQEDSVFFQRHNGVWNSIELSSSNIPIPYLRDIKFDAYGDKWLASYRGLLKFDGFNFTTYSEATSGVNSNHLNSIEIDGAGNIWTASADNNSSTPPLAMFDGINWINFSLNGNEANEVIYHQGNLYVATSAGIAIYDGVNWIYYNKQNSPIPEDLCFGITFDNNQNIWLTSYGGGIVKFDGINWTIFNSLNSGLPNDYCSEIFCDNLNIIWITSNDGLTKFDGINWYTFTFQNSNMPGIPGNLIQDKNGVIWAGHLNGMMSFDGSNFTDYNIFNSGVCSAIMGIAIDNANNKWLTTNSGGLVIFNENGIDPNAVFNLPTTKFEGNIYHDLNSDGVKDSLEYGLVSQKVLILPDSIFTFSNYSGNYFYAGDTGNYISEFIPYQNWQISSDSLLYHIQLDTVNLAGFDFGATASGNITNVEINLTSYMPRCFTTTNYYITYRNTGTVAVSGTIELTIDTAVAFINSFPTVSGNINNTYYWNFTDLKPFETRQIIVQLQLPGIAAPGDSLHFISNMLINQTNVATDRLDQEILCAYDPNDKTVEPVGVGFQHLTLKNGTLDYIIRFQNTGNDTAFAVFLIDTLNSFLDISTLDFVSGSHLCNVTCTSDRILKFHFENILLPPSETDDLNSNGYVHFKIKPFSGLPDSTVVTNRTFIYFDFNPPIETNTVFNTLVDSILTNLSEIYTEYNNFLIYPNPTNKSIKIEHNGNGKVIFKISDIYGRILKEGYIANRSEVDVSEIRNGLYFLNLYDGNKTNIVWKFIKN